jgi:asparagine synthase (glutamine-hydrolysing)
MRGIVPGAILNRTDKIGFATPEYKWLKALQSWVASTLSRDIANDIPVLDMPSIHRQWQDVLKGRKRFDSTVWGWINFIHWSEKHDISF